MARVGMTRFFIVRHGNTFDSADKPTRIGARTDLPLTASGQAQADALAAHFVAEGVIFTTAYTSPLCRAVETGERIVAQQPAVSVLGSLDILTEIDHGPDENRTEGDVIARIGMKALAKWDSDAVIPHDWIVNPKDRIAGWRDFFSEQVTTRPDEAILLVTSNGAARFSLKCNDVFAECLSKLDSLKLRTGAYGCLVLSTLEQGCIESWNIKPPD